MANINHKENERNESITFLLCAPIYCVIRLLRFYFDSKIISSHSLVDDDDDHDDEGDDDYDTVIAFDFYNFFGIYSVLR